MRTTLFGFYVLSFGLLSCATTSKTVSVGGEPDSRTMAQILEQSQSTDWRPLDPQNTLYMELAAGRVVIELAPTFAPNHVINVKQLVAEKYFDGLAIMRAQDNYVVQWGDADGTKPIQKARKNLPAEFSRTYEPQLRFQTLSEPDVYAPEVGFVNDMPAGIDRTTQTVWLTHCYGMVGAGRDEGADSGGGTELYAMIGHAPRHLDRNVTLLGRVVFGIELLSVLPRGPAPMGFYEKKEQHVPIKAIRLAADVPETERSHIEVLRTDTETFSALVESRRNRKENWYKYRAGHIELCNVPLPIRFVDHRR